MDSSSNGKKKVECPFCSYKMPLMFDSRTRCEGLYVRCKNKKCKKVFEVKIDSHLMG